MKLTKEEVLKIAALAKLELSEDEVETYSKQLSDILSYVDKLKEVNTDNVEPTSQVTGLENIYREDAVHPFEKMKELVEAAPESEENQIKVPSVFE